MNSSPQFTHKAQREMEDEFDNQREAYALLALIDTEFRSDPMSVQCFDLRIVKRVRECVAKREHFKKNSPFYYLDNDE